MPKHEVQQQFVELYTYDGITLPEDFPKYLAGQRDAFLDGIDFIMKFIDEADFRDDVVTPWGHPNGILTLNPDTPEPPDSVQALLATPTGGKSPLAYSYLCRLESGKWNWRRSPHVSLGMSGSHWVYFASEYAGYQVEVYG